MAHLSTKIDSKWSMANSSKHRTPSVKPSMRSSNSQTTIVEYNTDLDIKQEIAYGTMSEAKALSWSDHLLAVFCIRRPSRYISTTARRSSEPGDDDRQRQDNSPWILPVYVLSSRKDESSHFVPKEAKCIFDTGNLQGNVVSKAFVVDVLGYSEFSFQPLTKLEEAGGTGITGHKHFPQAAIHLTWYHNNSTRVFRDMRFLISDNPINDLVIGSQSIHQNKILDVPNLVNVIIPDPTSEEKAVDVLLNEFNEVEKEIAKLQLLVLKGKLTESSDPALWQEYKYLPTKRDIAEKRWKEGMVQEEISKIREKEKKSKMRDEKGRSDFLNKHGYAFPETQSGQTTT